MQHYTRPFRIDLPPAFKGDGTESFASWSRRFEVSVEAIASQSNQDSQVILASVLPTRLADAAFLYWDSLMPALKKDYSAVKDKMKEVFAQKQYIPFFQTYVNARPRKPNESLEVYGADITRLVFEAFPNYDNNAQKGETFRRFVAGLDPTLQSKIHEMGAGNLEEALTIASRCERAREALTLNTTRSTPQASTPQSAGDSQVAMVGARDNSDPQLLNAIETLTLKVDNLQSDVRQLKEKNHSLTQRLETWTDLHSTPTHGASYNRRSASPTDRQFQYQQRYYSSPERYHSRGFQSQQRYRPASPERHADQDGETADRGRPRYRSPDYAAWSREYERNTRQNSGADRPRSPSPARWESRNMSSSESRKRSVHFLSPNRHPSWDSTRHTQSENYQ